MVIFVRLKMKGFILRFVKMGFHIWSQLLTVYLNEYLMKNIPVGILVKGTLTMI